MELRQLVSLVQENRRQVRRALQHIQRVERRVGAPATDTPVTGGDTTDQPADPNQDPPTLLDEYHDTTTGYVLNLPDGQNRMLVVALHFEQASQTVANCLVGDVAMDLLSTQTEGDNGLVVFTLPEARFPTENLDNLVIAPEFGSSPTGDSQLHVYLFGNVTGTPSAVSGSYTSGTSLSADITTASDGEVVVAFCGTGNLRVPSTTYGTTQTGLTDDSSCSNSAYELASGTAGAQSIDWTFTGGINRMVWTTLRIGAVAPAAEDPTIPTGEGATTIWNTKISQAATLEPAGFGTTFTHNGTTKTGTAQIEHIWVNATDNTAATVNVWESRIRPSVGGYPQTRLIAQAKIPSGNQHVSDKQNDLGFVYDGDSVDGDILFGGGTYHRPTAGGDIYHNWQVPPNGHPGNDELGTMTAPGRGGQSGASRISAAGTMIRASEYTAAIAGSGDASAIPHALGFLTWCSPHVSRSNSGYRWPAYSADANYNQSPSHVGSYNGPYEYLRMGAHLALPRRLTSSDVSLLSGSSTWSKMLRAIAEALYLYGAYLVDNTAWAAYNITAEESGLPKTMTTQERYALRDVFTYLEVVTSSAPDAIGGGGAPRRS